MSNISRSGGQGTGGRTGDPLPVVLLGGGGHASDVLGVIEGTAGWSAIGFLDDRAHDGRTDRFSKRSLPSLGAMDALALLDADVHYLIAVGYPVGRRAVWEQIGDAPNQPATVIHPDADMGSGAELGAGVIVFAGARVSPGARIEDHTHVSYLSAVGHDTAVGPFSMVMPGAIVSGDVRIGAGVLIGTNATVLEGLTIGDGAQVAAGAVVVKNVPAGCTVVGIPARPLHAEGEGSDGQ
jgi:sugar O-acyltransferase (sialic acid O-acetyltransferase NeuD family)